jgi:chromate transporter
MGKTSILIFLFVYFILWILSSFYPDSIFGYCFVFVFCGTFSMGPAAGIFAYLYSYFTELSFISDSQMWIGFPLAYLIPGSVVNSGLYYGVLVDGIKGLLAAAIFLYLPCFTALFGILPSWKYYRNKPGVQRLTKGLICVTNGLLLGMVILFSYLFFR